MGEMRNALGQAIGETLEGWNGARIPKRKVLEGRFCYLERLSAEKHCSDLFAAFSEDKEGRNWTYLPYGPFDREEDFRALLNKFSRVEDPFFYSVIDMASGRAVGMGSFLRIDSNYGVIEVGHLNFSPLMQRSAMATEVQYLLMKYVFEELGYRRYEWKCDALNEPSRRAAERLGFQFEGIFRQAVVYKGRNRDTAWFSVIDKEWSALKLRFERWLDVSNFNADGRQIVRLGDIVDDAET